MAANFKSAIQRYFSQGAKINDSVKMISLSHQILRRLGTAWFNVQGGSRRSYSQCGEDMILDFAFRFLGVQRPSYLDIGAHDPRYLSNTAFFYARGSRGVNVEPDPRLFDKIRRVRHKDVNLNIGISDASGISKLFVMSSPELNTFCEDEARKIEASGKVRIVSVEEIKVRAVTEILDEHFSTKPPDLLSVDVEGMDLKILQGFDFQRHAPLAICIETIEYRADGTGAKRRELLDFLSSVGYFIYADTYINTICFHHEQFERLRARAILIESGK